MRLNRIFFLIFIFVISIQSTLAFLGKPATSQILSPGIVICKYQQIPTDRNYVITGFSKANGLQYAEIIYNATTKKCYLGERKWTNKGECYYYFIPLGYRFPFDLELPENAFLVGFGYDYNKGFKSFWYSYRKINPNCTLSDIEGSSSIGRSKSFYQDRAFVEYNDGAIIGLQLGRHKKHTTKEGKFSVGYRKFTNLFQCLMEGGEWLPNVPPTDSFDEYCCYPGNEGKLSPKGQKFASDYEFLCDGSRWHKADQEPFKIYEFDKKQYISNKARWYICNTTADTGIPDRTILPLGTNTSVYRFICYKQKFYECCIPEETCYSKDRYTEQSAQAIYPAEPITIIDRNNYSFTYEYHKAISPYISDNPISAYKGISLSINSSPLSKHLVFFVNLSSINPVTEVLLASGTASSIDNLDILIRGPIFAFANEIKTGKWIRIEIPLCYNRPHRYVNPIKIDQIIFYTNVTALTDPLKLAVKNIYLDTREPLFFCTDEFAQNDDYWILPKDLEKSKKICSNLYTWTGTKCCFNKTQSYVDEEGACINGLPILENESAFFTETKGNVRKPIACKERFCPKSIFIRKQTIPRFLSIFHMPTETIIYSYQLEKIKRDILYSNKKFYYCQNLVSTLSLPAKTEKSNPCTTFGNYFCSYEESWSNAFSGTPAGQRNTSSTDPFGRTKSCCHPLFCWNGSMCLASLHDKPQQTYNISGKTYRCVYGKWIAAPLKYDWFSNQSAYCPYPEQCLVDPNGNPNNYNKPETYSPDPGYTDNPICINHSQYIFDHLCYNGEWRTRTRTLASILLNLTTTANEFTLLCDDFKTTLPEPDLKLKYIQGESLFPAAPPTCFNFTTPIPCVNNFCVLKFIDSGKEKTLFAVSLNKPINDPEYSFLYALDLPTTYCNNVVDFDTCSNDDRIWYDPHLNAIFYSKQGITMRRGFFSRLFNIFKSIIQFITGTWKPKTMLGSLVNLSSIETHQNYDALFIAKKDNKQILALKETRANETYIIARLENITARLCDSLENMPQTFCNATATEQTVLSFNSSVWNQLIKLTPT